MGADLEGGVRGEEVQVGGGVGVGGEGAGERSDQQVEEDDEGQRRRQRRGIDGQRWPHEPHLPGDEHELGQVGGVGTGQGHGKQGGGE